MKRVILTSITLLVLIPVILLSWLMTTESGLHWAYQQARTYLPAELNIGQIQGKLLGPITLKGLEYKHEQAHISAEQLMLDWQPAALLLANVSIKQLQVKSLQVKLIDNSQTTTATTPAVSLPAIHLPWRISLSNAQIDGLSIQQNGQAYALKQLRLKASSVLSQLDIDTFEVETEQVQMTLKGKLQTRGYYRHKLNIQWQSTLPSSAVIRGKGQLAGDMKTTHIRQQLTGPLQLTLDAQLHELLNQLHWQANIDITAFNIAQLITDGPALSGKLQLQAKGDLETATVSGELKGHYADAGPVDANFEVQRRADNSLQINQLLLHAPVSETRIHAQGNWMPGDQGGNIKLALNWQKLRWPLTGVSWFNTAKGSGEIEGNLEQYRFKLSTDSPWPEIPDSTWHARGTGNLQGLPQLSLRVNALSGEAQATGELSWSPQLHWKADIKAIDIDPAIIWPQWPGQLNAKLLSQGQLVNNQLLADIDVIQLKGTLRGYPLSASSDLSWNNNGLDIKHLDLSSGTSTLSLQGRAGETLQLDWKVNSKHLAELYPQAQGQLISSGHLSGPINTPFINATMNARALSLPGYKLGKLEANVLLDMFQWQQIDVQLSAQDLQWNELTLKAVDIIADTKNLQAKLATESVAADITLRGTIDTKGYRGLIERADITSQKYHNWQLQAPVPLLIGKNRLQAETLCWHNHQQASLCASFQRQHERWQTQLDMTQLPLLLLSPWLPTHLSDLKLQGVANASANLQFQAPDQLLGRVSIELPSGKISYPLIEGERDTWEYHNSTITASLDKQGISAKSSFIINDNDRFALDIELPDAQLLTLNTQHQQLHAQAELNIHDLGLIEALAPEVQDLNGELKLNLQANGSLAQPRLSGQAWLHRGEFRIPRLGLNITQFNANAQSHGTDQIKLSLNAHSGDGELAIRGSTILDKNAGWPTEVTITGKQFEASRIPSAQVQISPELEIKVQHHTVNITGNIDIPIARLQPKDITTAAQTSDDAVIVGGARTRQQEWSLNSSVRLTLGERVNIYGFGFEGRLGGNLLVEDEPGQLTRATGEINIPEGRYRAYGQRLDVEHGRLLFTGGPLTNPGLDIRAVRHINNITAGVRVRGSLKQPQLELFSLPVMGQTDTLSYLLLGRPMENASGEEGEMMAKAALALSLSGGDYLARTIGEQFGLDEMRVESSDNGDQASLVVGRYLSPKLYVSYGVGLIEAINTFTVRYKISEKWQIKAESGESQGADILYTIER